MKENRFIQYFPSFLIMIGVVLWANNLLFSSVTNRHEAKLKNYWQANLENSSDVMDSSNVNLQSGVEAAILKRPDDKPLLDFGSRIVDFQRMATKALDKKLENADTNTFQIIQDFHKKTIELLWESADSLRMISDEEIERLLKQNSLLTTQLFNDLNYKIAFQKNQFYQRTTSYLNYLAGKIGGGTGCCFPQYEPIIQFTETLKVNNKTTVNLYFHYNPCGGHYTNEKWSVNGQLLSVKNGIASLTKTFDSTSPQTLNAEREYYQKRFKQHKIVIDTFIQKEQFIIHPIKK